MSRTKKVIATMLVSALVSGFAVTANAEESIMREPEHKHAFSVVNYTCYNSFVVGTHTYVSGSKVDDKGNVTSVYSTCTITVKQYRGEWKCACGASDGMYETSETQHSGCGL